MKLSWIVLQFLYSIFFHGHGHPNDVTSRINTNSPCLNMLLFLSLPDHIGFLITILHCFFWVFYPLTGGKVIYSADIEILIILN